MTITEERRPARIRDGVEVASAAGTILTRVECAVIVRADLSASYDLRRSLHALVAGAPVGAEVHVRVGDQWPAVPPGQELARLSLFRVEASTPEVARDWRMAIADRFAEVRA